MGSAGAIIICLNQVDCAVYSLLHYYRIALCLLQMSQNYSVTSRIIRDLHSCSGDLLYHRKLLLYTHRATLPQRAATLCTQSYFTIETFYSIHIKLLYHREYLLLYTHSATLSQRELLLYTRGYSTIESCCSIHGATLPQRAAILYTQSYFTIKRAATLQT